MSYALSFGYGVGLGAAFGYGVGFGAHVAAVLLTAGRGDRRAMVLAMALVAGVAWPLFMAMELWRGWRQA